MLQEAMELSRKTTELEMKERQLEEERLRQEEEEMLRKALRLSEEETEWNQKQLQAEKLDYQRAVAASLALEVGLILLVLGGGGQSCYSLVTDQPSYLASCCHVQRAISDHENAIKNISTKVEAERERQQVFLSFSLSLSLFFVLRLHDLTFDLA